jgi:hypothetical protein
MATALAGARFVGKASMGMARVSMEASTMVPVLRARAVNERHGRDGLGTNED